MSKQGLRPLLAVLTLAAAVPLAQAAEHIGFVPATLTRTQNARLTLVNLTNPTRPGRNTTPPDPCKAQVTFFDAQGEKVGDTQDVSLEPGNSLLLPAVQKAAGDGSVDVSPLRHVRATIAFPPGPCLNLQAGFEVYDTQTGNTLFMNPGVIRGFNPQPDPPG
jgi:hypothetical protein